MKWNRTVAALVAAMMLAAVPAMAMAAPGVVITDSLTLQQSAGGTQTDGTVLENGRFVEILGESGDWVRVSVTGGAAVEEGYLPKDNIVVEPVYATGREAASIYAMPDGTSPVVGTIEPDEQLVVLGVWEAYLAVNLRTASGFVRMDDVYYNGPRPTATARPTARPTATATAAPGIPVRYTVIRETPMYAEPNGASGVTARMAPGSIVTIALIQNGYGYDIDSRHWVPMRDLVRYVPGETIVVETIEPAIRYVVIGDGTAVRVEPNASAPIVDTLAADTLVVVGEHSGGYGRVTYGGGQRGWVLLGEMVQMAR